MPKTTKRLSDEEKKKKNRERMRKIRQDKKNNPEAYEEEKLKERERYHRRVQAGKIKKVNDLTNREKRVRRKAWREKTKHSREKKRLMAEIERQTDENSPPPSPENIIIMDPAPTRQKESGKKRIRKKRREMKNEIARLKDENEKLKRECNRLKKRNQREVTSVTKKNTPRKTVKRLLKGSNVTAHVRKELIFMEVLKTQIHSNYMSRKKLAERQIILKSMLGNVVDKYTCATKVATVVARHRKKRIENLKNITKTQLQVKHFFEQDDNSRMCAGKKECITKDKEKKQRRYLTDSMKNLFKKFKGAYPLVKLGYSTFCRLRPFWVLPPPKKRETCLCVHHENVDLVVAKLSQMNIIKFKTSQDLVKSLCCDTSTEECLTRACQNCKLKTIEYNLDPLQKNDTTSYEKWVKKK